MAMHFFGSSDPRLTDYESAPCCEMEGGRVCQPALGHAGITGCPCSLNFQALACNPSQFHTALTTPASERQSHDQERERARERERGRVGERGKGVVARSFPLRVVEDGCRSTRISLSQKQAPSSRLSLCTHPTPLGVISLHRRVETLRTAFRQPGEGEGVVRTRARGEKIVSLSLSLPLSSVAKS